MKMFKIIGRQYGTEKKYYDWSKNHKYYTYDKIAEHEFPPKKFESVRHAEKWLLENFPEWYFGANIKGVDNNDFTMIAVPQFFEMEFGTNDREQIAKRVLALGQW